MPHTATLTPAARIDDSLPTPSGLSKRELSRAIGFARIVLIIGLVFIHYDQFPNSSASPFNGLDLREHVFATWLESAILFFFFSVVPLLSMVSGWLFFSFRPEHGWLSVRRRMWKRFISLYLPLVGWNAMYFVGIWLFWRGHPDSPFMSNLEFTFPIQRPLDFINAIFGVTHRPIGFQFWFVRDLFVTSLISPIYFLLINYLPMRHPLLRYTPWAGALILAAAWLHGSHMLIFWRPDVPFFFYLGALLHQKNVKITMPLRTALALTAVYVALAGLRALAPYYIDTVAHKHIVDMATCLMRLVGVAGCWGIIYRLAQTKRGLVIGGYGGLAFFLHSAHWPLLVVLKMWLWPLMPGTSDFWMLFHYVLCVTITVVIGVGVGRLLALKLPRVFALMNGGRDLVARNKTDAPDGSINAVKLVP